MSVGINGFGPMLHLTDSWNVYNENGALWIDDLCFSAAVKGKLSCLI